MSPTLTSVISPIEDIIAELARGRMVVLIDEEDRENEGDLVLAAEYVTPEAINFMVTHARGLVCLTITEARAAQLGLSPMTTQNKSAFSTAFTTSIEAASGVSTGISAADRARTIQVAVARGARPEDVVQPGHIFPIIAKPGGVLVRAGHTEAGCDLARLAGVEPTSVICEILNEDGSMARLPDLVTFAARHQLKIGTIADLIHFRSHTETLVERRFSKPVNTPYGAFTLHTYLDRVSNKIHFALVKGEISQHAETLVRVHEPLTVFDFLDTTDARHSFSLDFSLRYFARHEQGVIVLLRQDDAEEHILDTWLHPTAPHTAPKWDPRLYGIGAQILRDLGVQKMRLLASPRRIPSMTGFGLEITSYINSSDEISFPSSLQEP